MQQKNKAFYLVFTGTAILIALGVFLFTAPTASAQCGSQASSCKNCHEVQGEMSVNSDGTGWHQSHAFGDFCYICHAGNNQATEKAAAHEGMVAPLEDVQAACQQCHVADLNERAQVYADALGVDIGSGSAPQAAAGADAAPMAVDSAVSAPTSNSCNEVVVDDPNAIDYAANYDEIVLGKKPVNWGNNILLGLIGLLVVGGGGFVITREKFINVKFGDTKAVDNEYPADVVDMLPKLAGLKAGTRKSLKNVLENKKVDKVLDLMDTITKKDEE